MTRDNSNKLRAVFLAALMFLWLFAGTVAFAGSAAAVSIDDGDVDPIQGVANTAGETFYQGQTVMINLNDTTVNGNDIGENEDVAIRQIDDDSTSSAGLVSTRLDEDTDEIFIRLRTSQLEGGESYTLRSSTLFANESENAFNAQDLDDAAQWEVAAQQLDVQFDEDQVRSGDEVEVSFESIQRTSYNVTVEDADGNLDTEELESIFAAKGAFENSDDEVEFELTDSFDEFDADFDDIDAGDYEFEFEVTDTDAEATASITVQEEIDGEVDFVDAQVSQDRGDIVEINFESTGLEEGDTFNLTIGDDDDVGYEANMTVELNDDEEATIEMNTFLAGNRTGAGEGETFEATEGSVSNIDLVTEDPLDRVLDVGNYDMIVEVQGEETDVATLDIVARSTNEQNIWTVPDGEISSPDDGEYDVEDILELADEGKLTPTDTIAIADEDRDHNDRRGDVIVHELDASGIFGAVDALNAQNASALEGNITVSYEQLNPRSNRAPAELNSTEPLKLVPDDENNTLYVIADSDDLSLDQGGNDDIDLRVDDEFETSIELSTDYLEQFTRDDLEEGEDEETVTADFEFVDRELTFDTVGDNITVPPNEDAQIMGDTTVAPGTELRVRTRASGDNAFLRTADVDVTADREFTAEFDFSDRPSGQEFTASVRQQSFDDNAEQDGVIGELEGAVFTVSDLEPQDAEVDQGDVIDVSATITNEGDESGTQTVQLTLDGDEIDSQEVELDEGDDTIVEFTDVDTSDLEGTYEHAIATDDDSASGTLTVNVDEPETDDEEPPETDDEEPPETDDSEPPATDDEEPPEDQAGFGAVVALVALLAAALLAARRSSLN